MWNSTDEHQDSVCTLEAVRQRRYDKLQEWSLWGQVYCVESWSLWHVLQEYSHKFLPTALWGSLQTDAEDMHHALFEVPCKCPMITSLIRIVFNQVSAVRGLVQANMLRKPLLHFFFNDINVIVVFICFLQVILSFSIFLSLSVEIRISSTSAVTPQSRFCWASVSNPPVTVSVPNDVSQPPRHDWIWQTPCLIL